MASLLTLLYIAARAARDLYWAVRRPHLFGVRAVVIAPDDTVLLVRHRAGPHAWVLPGGGIEAGESASHAAAREISEEAGVTINATTLHLHGIFSGAHVVHPCDVSVVVARLDTTPPPRPSPWSIEIAAARFVHPRDFATLDDTVEPGCARRIAEVTQAHPIARTW
jgi:8-oxo-dGTP pyrophosphatase MutT (NUDIX family)